MWIWYVFICSRMCSSSPSLSLYPIVSFRFENNFGIAIDKRKEEAFALDKVFIINTYAVMYLANGLRMRWGVWFYGSQEISFDENKNTLAYMYLRSYVRINNHMRVYVAYYPVAVSWLNAIVYFAIFSSYKVYCW